MIQKWSVKKPQISVINQKDLSPKSWLDPMAAVFVSPGADTSQCTQIEVGCLPTGARWELDISVSYGAFHIVMVPWNGWVL